jgi:hypothetical protein
MIAAVADAVRAAGRAPSYRPGHRVARRLADHDDAGADGRRCGRADPVLAAGGIADGRGLVAALSLGADDLLKLPRWRGIPAACSFKRASSTATADTCSGDSRSCGGLVWPGAMSRSRRNRFIERWAGREWALRQGGRERTRRCRRPPQRRCRRSVISMGRGSHPTSCRRIVARIAQQAERILRERLPRFQRN